MLLTYILIGVIAWTALVVLGVVLSSAASRGEATKEIAYRTSPPLYK